MNIWYIKSPIVLTVLTLLVFSGVATGDQHTNNIDVYSDTKLKSFFNENDVAEGSENSLSLSEAVQRVLKKNPGLLSLKWEILSKDGLILQESLRPNPEIDIELENFAGSRGTRGFSNSEITVQISQTILIGGKRKKKIKTAEKGKVISIKAYERKISDLVSETKKRFIKTLYIQKKLTLMEEMVDLTDQFLKKITSRVTAGRTSPAELSRAEVALLRNKLTLERIKKEMFASRQLLTSLWGGTKPDFEKVTGRLDIYSIVPKIDIFENRLSRNTDLRYISSEIDYRRSLLTLEKANKIPNPTISGGIRRLNELESTAFAFSFSIPIPVLNRNQGTIRTADYLLKKSEHSYHAAEVKIRNELIALYEMLKNAHNNAWALKSEILPQALKAFITISNGYDLGKFSYLEVFDAYRTQLEVREEYLENALRYWYLMADIERLNGAGIGEFRIERTKKGEKNENE